MSSIPTSLESPQGVLGRGDVSESPTVGVTDTRFAALQTAILRVQNRAREALHHAGIDASPQLVRALSAVHEAAADVLSMWVSILGPGLSTASLARNGVEAAGHSDSNTIRASSPEVDSESRGRFALEKKREADELMKAGRYEDAILKYTDALARAPAATNIHNNLAIAFLRTARYDEASAVLKQAFFNRFGLASEMRDHFSPSSELAKQSAAWASPFKLTDRADQIEYLVSTKKVDPSFGELAQRYRDIAKQLAGDSMRVEDLPLDVASRSRLGGYLDKCLYYADIEQLHKSVLNDRTDYQALENEYLHRGGFVCVDDALEPHALSDLQRFIRESTVFFRDSNLGFVGSFLQDGLNSRTLMQIAAEFTQKLPRIFENYPLGNAWCYRYASRNEGVRPHSDRAAVTVNLWLTPDDANLDPSHGGIVIFNKEHPEEWDWETFNMRKADTWIQSHIETYLRDAQSFTIPYKCNRAVIFRSKLFHKSDPFHFADDFLSRRVNVTMIFGRSGPGLASLA